MLLPELLLSRNYRNGFTLVEILIAIAAIGLLFMLALPVYENHQAHSHIEQATKDIRLISITVTQYELANNKLPNDLSVIGMNSMQDPWGMPYQYAIHGLALPKQSRKDKNLRPINNDYDLYSRGKDNKSTSALFEEFSHDDIVRANNGKWIGIADTY
ncbi:MAG: prepilin-type N-terminal cleavage/methylation domain-containing protein [Gammaproteobacteria bacterium]